MKLTRAKFVMMAIQLLVMDVTLPVKLRAASFAQLTAPACVSPRLDVVTELWRVTKPVTMRIPTAGMAVIQTVLLKLDGFAPKGNTLKPLKGLIVLNKLPVEMALLIPTSIATTLLRGPKSAPTA